MHTLLEVIGRTAAAFLLIMIVTRMLGKQTITQMTYHDFVSSITLGGITSNLAFNTSLKSWNLTAALLIFGGVAFALTHLSLKYRSMRKWFSGKPTVVIENGKLLESNLRKQKFSLDTLNQELREKDIFDIAEVEYAVLELNGKLSVLKKPEYRPVTRKDMSLAAQAEPRFPVELIMDGKIVDENLRHGGLSPEWLSKQLRQRGLKAEQVFYAVKGTNGSLFFDLYGDKIKHPINTE